MRPVGGLKSITETPDELRMAQNRRKGDEGGESMDKRKAFARGRDHATVKDRKCATDRFALVLIERALDRTEMLKEERLTSRKRPFAVQAVSQRKHGASRCRIIKSCRSSYTFLF